MQEPNQTALQEMSAVQDRSLVLTNLASARYTHGMGVWGGRQVSKSHG